MSDSKLPLLKLIGPYLIDDERIMNLTQVKLYYIYKYVF